MHDMWFLPMYVSLSKQWKQKTKFDDIMKQHGIMGFVYFIVYLMKISASDSEEEVMY